MKRAGGGWWIGGNQIIPSSSLHIIRSTPRTHNQHIHREYYARVYDDEKHRATLPNDDKNSEEDYQGKGCLC
tara:strand:+ start:1707 stop:1922 length:216 start_codon:yes stop_codon:yes gene_type:complete